MRILVGKEQRENHPAAAYNLGIGYLGGLGIRRNFVKSYVWLSIVAILGYLGSKEQLAQLQSRLFIGQIEEGRKQTR